MTDHLLNSFARLGPKHKAPETCESTNSQSIPCPRSLQEPVVNHFPVRSTKAQYATNNANQPSRLWIIGMMKALSHRILPRLRDRKAQKNPLLRGVPREGFGSFEPYAASILKATCLSYQYSFRCRLQEKCQLHHNTFSPRPH